MCNLLNNDGGAKVMNTRRNFFSEKDVLINNNFEDKMYSPYLEWYYRYF